MSRRALVATAVLAAGILPRLVQAQPPRSIPAVQAQTDEQPGGARPQAGDLKAQVAAIRKDVDQLKAAAAQSQTLSGSVQQLSARVSSLEQQIDRAGRQRAASGEVTGTLDRLGAQTAELQRDVESLRTQVSGMEQPSAGPGGGGVAYQRGFELTTADGAYALKIGGFFQPRYEVAAPDGLDSVNQATFRLRRARVAFSGHVGGEEITYKVQLEVAADEPPGVDYFVDYEFAPELAVRAGQDKLYFTRAWWTGDTSIDILERPAAVEGLRYERDIGLWVHGSLLDERIYYHAGMSNGAGANQRNDNIDLISLARLDATLLGSSFDPLSSNRTRDPELRVVAGAGVVHDLTQLPAQIAGTAVTNRDVDGNGENDNVRVWSTSADLALRWHGLELVAEGLWRHERWGTILDHADNAAVAALISPDSEGHRNYLAGYIHASYPIVEERLQVAARIGHSRIALLGVGGETVDAVPPGDRLVEATAQLRFFHGFHLSLGGSYTYFNHNTRSGPEQADDIEHVFIGQGQFNF